MRMVHTAESKVHPCVPSILIYKCPEFDLVGLSQIPKTPDMSVRSILANNHHMTYCLVSLFLNSETGSKRAYRAIIVNHNRFTVLADNHTTSTKPKISSPILAGP